jgi:hypothetical protein
VSVLTVSFLAYFGNFRRVTPALLRFLPPTDSQFSVNFFSEWRKYRDCSVATCFIPVEIDCKVYL